MRRWTNDDPNGLTADARLHLRTLPGFAPPEPGAAAVAAAHSWGPGGAARISRDHGGRGDAGRPHALRARHAEPIDAAYLLGPLSRAGRGWRHLYGCRTLSHRTLGHRAGRIAGDPGPEFSPPRCGRAPTTTPPGCRTPASADRHRRFLPTLRPCGAARRLRRGSPAVGRPRRHRRYAVPGRAGTRAWTSSALRIWWWRLAGPGGPGGGRCHRGRIAGQGPRRS